jgi:hypothetical protein
MVRVIPHETICQIVNTVTGLSIRCIGKECPNFNKNRRVCQMHEPLKED